MQTAQLTINGQITTEFFAVLFLFPCREKDRTAEVSAVRNLLGSFSLLFFFFWCVCVGGHFGVKHG